MCLKEDEFEYECYGVLGFGVLLIGGNSTWHDEQRRQKNRGDKSTGCIWMHHINQFGSTIWYKERENVKWCFKMTKKHGEPEWQS